jgi:isoamylase
MTPPIPGRPKVVAISQTLERVWSPQLRNRRDVDVYLPPSYETSGRRRYPVVYMHDGQNLSDPATAFAGTWQLDEVLGELADRGLEAIVVGVHNTDERLSEYSPFPERRHGEGRADSYLAFLADTLRPRIDRLFRATRLPRLTVTIGSSMGGLFSLYAFFRRPDLFGAAGVMSPSLWFGRERVFGFIEAASRPPGRVYLDVGTGEGAATLRDVRRLGALLESKGFKRDWTLAYLEDRSGRHEEAAWSRRAGGALAFLLNAT